MNRKFLLVIPMITLLASLAFAGGGNQAAAAASSNEVVFFTYNQNSPGITYWNDTLWLKELEKRTGVKITVEGPLGSALYLEAANVALASGDVKDLFNYNWANYNGGIVGAVNDGIALNYGLNQGYLAQLPNWMKIINERRDVRRDITLDGGGMAQFAPISENRYLQAYSGIMMRQDWLDRLGHQVPKTLTEFHSVLTAFKQRDANGNGDLNDEIPYTDNGAACFAQIISAWGLRHNMFYPDPQNPGKLTYWTLYKNGQAFTDCVTTLAQWAREGLLDLESFAQSNDQRIQKIVSNRAGSSPTMTSSFVVWRDAINQLQPGTNARLVALPRLVGPDNRGYNIHDGYIRMAGVHQSWTINTKSEREGKMGNILKLIDYMYSVEGSELQNYGVEGVSFTRGPNNTHIWTDVISKDPILPVTEKVLQFATPHVGLFPKMVPYEGWLMSVPDPDQQAGHRVFLADTDDGLLMPLFFLNPAQSSEYNAIMADINTATSEFFAAVIRGTRPVSDIPGFLTQIQNMRINRALAIYQDAYDNYMKK